MTSWLKTDVAESVPFEESSFLADNVHDGIIEARNTAAGLPRYPVVLIMNGTMSNGDWITYSNLTPDSPIRIPVKSVLSEIVWDNRRTSVDFDMDFHKNGRGTASYRTSEIRNVDYGDLITGLSDPFDANDTLDIKYVDRGTNASDLTTVLYFKAVV